MGDIADWMIEQMIDQGLWGLGAPRVSRNRDAYGPPLTCRNCGSKNVYWQAVKGQFEIFNKDTLTRHECQVNDTEGFEDVV